MSSTEDDSDKQYEPSQKKLEDARKKGEIARSADLHTAGSYAGFLLVLVTFGPTGLEATATVLRSLIEQPDRLAQLFFSGAAPLNGGLLWEVSSGLLPWFAGAAALAILSVLLQRAFVVAPDKIAPKLNRISPLAGFKNKFGAQGLFEFAKSAAKLLIYLGTLGIYLVFQIDRIAASLTLAPGQVVVELGRMLAGLLAIILLISLVLGTFDYLWQRGHHLRKNRMSRKEMMDELKQAEGDPLMKQQRRQRGQDIAMNRMLADVPKADVVIVNPTHYAVALTWNRGSQAPVCVAKGVDETAARMREIAMEYAVPIHSDPPAARALYAEVRLGQEIQPDHYKAVAAAIRFADKMRKSARP